jgi:hypothetical protein
VVNHLISEKEIEMYHDEQMTKLVVLLFQKIAKLMYFSIIIIVAEKLHLLLADTTTRNLQKDF